MKNSELQKLTEKEFITKSPTELVTYFHENRESKNTKIKDFIFSRTDISYDRFTKKINSQFTYDKIEKIYKLDAKKNKPLKNRKLIKKESNNLSTINIDNVQNENEIETQNEIILESTTSNLKNSINKQQEIIVKNYKVLKEKRKIVSFYASERLMDILSKIQENENSDYHFANLSRSDIINIAINFLVENYGV